MNDQPGDVLADSLGYWLCRLEREMHAASNRGFAPFGVSTPEWVVLAHISRGFDTPTVLADELGIDRAAVTRALGTLQGKGLIWTAPHPSDRRSTVLKLTSQGVDLMPKLAAASRAIDRSFLDGLSGEDARVLLRLVRRVAERPTQGSPVAPNGGSKV